MKQVALTAALVRLRRASVAVESLQRAQNHEEAETAWTNFLIAAAGVYGKLEKGVDAAGPSKGWFDKIKNQRSTDPLLRYMEQARNADEHGIEPVAKRNPGGMGIGGRGAIRLGGVIGGPSGKMNLRATSLDGQPIAVTVYGPHLELAAVTNRKVTYQVPNTHLDKPIQQTPLEFATLTLNYFIKIVDDAKALVR
jgi:hypothetical protein